MGLNTELDVEFDKALPPYETLETLSASNIVSSYLAKQIEDVADNDNDNETAEEEEEIISTSAAFAATESLKMYAKQRGDCELLKLASNMSFKVTTMPKNDVQTSITCFFK